MGKNTEPSGACCLPMADGLSYIKIGAQGHVVGMMNLETIFQQLWLMQRKPQDASDEELIGMARRFNYIPRKPAIEADYAEALRKAYKIYYQRQEVKNEP